MMSSSSTVTLSQTGNSTACITSIAPSTWVIDSRVSDHMTENKHILSTLNSISSPFFVTLAYGSTSYTEGVGAAYVTPSLSLSSALYISKFLFNLLFVSRLTKFLNCSVTFFFPLIIMYFKNLERRRRLAHVMNVEVFMILREVLKR